MKQLEIVLSVADDGIITGMYSDEFSLAFLGKQNIARASDIRFDSDAQKWYIWLPDTVGEFIIDCKEFPFDTYEGAREFEVQWFNAARIRGCHPRSYNGLELAKFLYQTANIR